MPLKSCLPQIGSHFNPLVLLGGALRFVPGSLPHALRLVRTSKEASKFTGGIQPLPSFCFPCLCRSLESSCHTLPGSHPVVGERLL